MEDGRKKKEKKGEIGKKEEGRRKKEELSPPWYFLYEGRHNLQHNSKKSRGGFDEIKNRNRVRQETAQHTTPITL